MKSRTASRKPEWGRRRLLSGGPVDFWEGAVVSLPIELHSAVSCCCLLTKMAPNASPCEIPLWLQDSHLPVGFCLQLGVQEHSLSGCLMLRMRGEKGKDGAVKTQP